MVKGIRTRWLAGALGCVAVVGLAGEVRAGFYAYAVQQTSNYTFTGAQLGTLIPLSSTSSAQVGSPTGSEAHVGGFDSLQSYVGPAAGRPAENTFTPVGQVNADYARGDALVTSAPAAFGTNNVAEAYLAGAGSSSGSGSWAVSALITLSTSGVVTLAFDYTNRLNIVNTGSPFPGTVTADYLYAFTVQDSTGAVVFTSSPTALNRSISLSSAGSVDLPGSGSISIATGVLGPGTYTSTISGSEHTFITSTIPEPSAIVSAGIAVAAMAGVGIKKRLRRA